MRCVAQVVEFLIDLLRRKTPDAELALASRHEIAQGLVEGLTAVSHHGAENRLHQLMLALLKPNPAQTDAAAKAAKQKEGCS